MSISKKKKIKIISFIAFLLILGGLLVFTFSGDNFQILLDIFNKDLTKEQVQEHLSELGYKGVLSLIILSMLQVVLTVFPAEPIEVMAGVSYGFLNGMLICLAGVIIGNTIIYLLHKYYGGRITQFFDDNIDVDLEAASMTNKITLVILILYVLPAIPYGFICFFAASLKLKYPRYIWVTTLGSIPSTFIGVGLGHMAISTSWIVSIIVLVVLVILILILMKNKAKVFAKVNQFFKNSQKPYSSRFTVKKYGKVFYTVASFFGRLWLKTKIKCDLSKPVKNIDKPAVILSTHGSFIDFMYAGMYLRKVEAHYVAARLYFYSKRLGGIMKRVGCFPKSMFETDIENAKNCFKVIQMGRTLSMMPEARLSTVGKFEDIQPGTIKLIKKLGVPIYIIKLNGSYFAKPKWGDKIRKGAKVEIEFFKLLEAEEVKELDERVLQEKIENAICYDDFAWLEKHPELKYKSKTLAVGLENILTRCPKCGKKYTFTTKNREIKCSHCGETFILNDRYSFEENPYFTNFAKWYEWQTSEYEKEIKENPNFELRCKVLLKHQSYDGKKMLRDSGYGECVLNRDGLTYRGEEDGKTIEKLFPMSKISYLLFGAGEDFEIYEGEQLYYFVPEEKRSCVDYYIVSGLLKKLTKNEQ